MRSRLPRSHLLQQSDRHFRRAQMGIIRRAPQFITAGPLPVRLDHRQMVKVTTVTKDPPGLTPGTIQNNERRYPLTTGYPLEHPMRVIIPRRKHQARGIALILQRGEQIRRRFGAGPLKNARLGDRIQDQPPRIGRFVQLIVVRQQPELTLHGNELAPLADTSVGGQPAPITSFHPGASGHKGLSGGIFGFHSASC